MAQGGRGKKRCHFPPEGDIIGNAITQKCKLGMLTYITMDISFCPSEWYQSEVSVTQLFYSPSISRVEVFVTWLIFYPVSNGWGNFNVEFHYV